jgi:hypothetical protein
MLSYYRFLLEAGKGAISQLYLALLFYYGMRLELDFFLWGLLIKSAKSICRAKEGSILNHK